MKPTDRMIFLQLAKIAKERGTLNNTLYRVYARSMVRALKRERAAAVTATQNDQLQKLS